MQVDGFNVLRVAKLDKDGSPVLNDGEGAIERDGVFYVIDNEITLE